MSVALYGLLQKLVYDNKVKEQSELQQILRVRLPSMHSDVTVCNVWPPIGRLSETLPTQLENLSKHYV